ncbi:MAG: asparagine synthase-related protein, partial [Burkholderiales bacterium]
NRLGAANVFTAEFLAAVDIEHPFALMNSIYRGAHAKTQINRLLALDIKFTLADNDLPKVTQTCHLSGVNAGFPLLDDNVVAFSAALAPQLKLKGTKLRYFFKEALRGFLPDAILTKSKHGFGLPFGEWLRNNEALQTLSYDSLESLKGRGIIQAEFIDELRKLHQIHSGYYGTLIWVLMMLEQWFRAHQDID